MQTAAPTSLLKSIVKQCSAIISTLTSAAQLYMSTGAQAQI